MRARGVGRDGELPAALAADLEGSFARLVLAYQDRIFGFSLRMLGDPRDAEEAAQDAFVRAYRALGGYPDQRIRALALPPWLYRIALNVCRNRLRTVRPVLVPIDPKGDGEHDGPGDLPDEESLRPEAVAEQGESRREMARALAALPERYRTAVVLRFVQALPYAEIAEILHQPVGTAKANVHRGVRLLRSRLAEQERGRTERVEERR